MVKKLLFIMCFVLSLSVSAQQTYDIDWGFNSTSDVTPADAPTNADRTIEVGDTVRWTWYASGNHNVVSNPGSQENFMSGTTETDTQPPDFVYSYTFTEIGENDYRCDPHESIMFGTITVLADGTLNVSMFNQISEFEIVPNPSKNWLNIKLGNYIDDLKVEVFNVLGKRVYAGMITQLNASVNVSNWNSGVYLVRLSNDKTTHTKRFIKQ